MYFKLTYQLSPLQFHCNVGFTSATSSARKEISDSALKLLLETYEHFDLIDLLKFSIENPKNHAAVEIVFNHWFLGIKFEIISPNLSPKGTFNDTLDVVEHFGHLITNLKVDYRLLDTNQSEKLNEYLNIYCLDSLTDIELVHCDSDKIANLHGPFERVENVQFHLGNLRKTALKFQEIFPSIRSLNLGEMYYTHPGCFEHSFPLLENLTVEFWYGFYPYTVAQLEKRVQSNPQLKHITISRCTWPMLELLSKQLQNLESLTLEEFRDDSIFPGNLHFENLKILKFKPKSKFREQIGQIPIVFGKLEEIEFHDSSSEWIEIMKENRDLKTVTTGLLSDTQFFQILNAVPNLKDFCTGYNTIAPTDNIIRFMRKAMNLKRVEFTAIDFRVSNKIMERKDPEWKAANGAFVRV